MCVFLISPVPTAEPITPELIDTPVFHNLAPRLLRYFFKKNVQMSNNFDALILNMLNE